MLRSPVPCNGCVQCCRGELVVLFPEDGDDLTRLEHIEMPSQYGQISVLKHKENGDCVYLGEHGCTIYDRAPAVCKSFDCRKYFLSMTRDERRLHEKHGENKRAVFKAGRSRVHTLTMAERQEAMAMRAKPDLPSRQMLRKTMVGP